MVRYIAPYWFRVNGGHGPPYLRIPRFYIGGWERDPRLTAGAGKETHGIKSMAEYFVKILFIIRNSA